MSDQGTEVRPTSPTRLQFRAAGCSLTGADGVVVVALLLLATLYYLSYFSYDLNPSDEGYLCYGALRALHGQTPGADFHAYEPGRYWVLAAAYELLGVDVLTERILHLVLRLVILVLGYAAARLYLPIPLSIVASVGTLIVPGPWHKSWFTVFMVLAFLVAEHHARRPRPWLVAAGGASAGVSAVFRVDATLFALCMLAVSILTAQSRTSRPLGSRLLRDAAVLAVGAIGPVVATAVLLVSKKSLLASVRFYLAEYASFSSSLERIHPKIEGFPTLAWSIRTATEDLVGITIWFSILSAVILLSAVAGQWKRSPVSALADARLVLAWALCFAGVATQPDRPHLLQQGTLLLITAVVAVSRTEQSLRTLAQKGDRSTTSSRRTFLLSATLIAVFVWGNVFGAGINSYYTGSIRMRFGANTPFGHPRASLTVSDWVVDEFGDILSFVERHTQESDGIATCFCLPMFNFLSHRENPTGLDILFPHTVGTPAQQERFIHSLDEVRFFLVNSCEFDGRHPDGCPGGHNTLADFAPLVYRHIQLQWHQVYQSPTGFVTIFARDGDPMVTAFAGRPRTPSGPPT